MLTCLRAGLFARVAKVIHNYTLLQCLEKIEDYQGAECTGVYFHTTGHPCYHKLPLITANISLQPTDFHSHWWIDRTQEFGDKERRNIGGITTDCSSSRHTGAWIHCCATSATQQYPDARCWAKWYTSVWIQLRTCLQTTHFTIRRIWLHIRIRDELSIE
jgi:hypothetical protein